MIKYSITSQSDFLPLEEISDRAAETISGGAEVTTGTEVTVDTDDIFFPIEGPTRLIDSVSALIEAIRGIGPGLEMISLLLSGDNGDGES